MMANEFAAIAMVPRGAMMTVAAMYAPLEMRFCSQSGHDMFNAILRIPLRLSLIVRASSSGSGLSLSSMQDVFAYIYRKMPAESVESDVPMAAPFITAKASRSQNIQCHQYTTNRTMDYFFNTKATTVSTCVVCGNISTGVT